MSPAAQHLTLSEAVEATVRDITRRDISGYDFVATESSRLAVDLFAGRVAKHQVSTSRGIGLRVFRGRRCGLAYAERLSVDGIREAVDAAASQLGVGRELELDLPHPETSPLPDLQLDNPALQSVSADTMAAFLTEVEDEARAADSRVENVPHLGMSRTRQTSIVCNSNGVCQPSRQASVVATVGAIATSGGVRKMGTHTCGGRVFDFDPGGMARTAAERAVELLGAAPVSSGRFPVVFSSRVASLLFARFVQPFYGDAVLGGRSRLAGKVGRAIAAPALTIESDPHIPLAPGSRHFDDEGVATRRVEVVRDGVLIGFLHTLESARRAGAEPTGSGARDGAGRLAPRFDNLVVRPGSSTLHELLAARPRLLFIVQIDGAAACSPVSGDISIGVQGFLHERGRRIRPVDQVTLSTSFFDLLTGIRGLSATCSEDFSSVKVPDVLVDDVHISGDRT